MKVMVNKRKVVFKNVYLNLEHVLVSGISKEKRMVFGIVSKSDEVILLFSSIPNRRNYCNRKYFASCFVGFTNFRGQRSQKAVIVFLGVFFCSRKPYEIMHIIESNFIYMLFVDG